MNRSHPHSRKHSNGIPPSIDLLRKIPRLEEIAWMVSQQNTRFDSSGADTASDLVIGAEVLRVATEFDDMKAKGVGHRSHANGSELRQHSARGPCRVSSASGPGSEGMVPWTIPVPALAVGMVLQEDVATDSGVLIAVRGQELTYSLIVCLNNFHRQGEIPQELLVLCPSDQKVAAEVSM